LDLFRQCGIFLLDVLRQCGIFSVGCVPTSVLVHYRYLGSNIFPAV
jgi:hypothetical protein